jgi:hypothetical protein
LAPLAVFQHLQRRQAGKAGQVVVGQDHVPVLVQFATEFAGRFDAQTLGIDPAATQLGDRQQMVELGVFDMQHAQRFDGGTGIHARKYRAAKPRPRRARRTKSGAFYPVIGL